MPTPSELVSMKEKAQAIVDGLVGPRSEAAEYGAGVTILQLALAQVIGRSLKEVPHQSRGVHVSGIMESLRNEIEKEIT